MPRPFHHRRGLLSLVFSLLLVGVLASHVSVANVNATATSYNTVQPLSYRVIDAEYSHTLNRIVMVGDAPNRLHIYNPVDHTTVSVPLPRAPLNVSVGPDGHFAAVGHDALVSYVDLQQGILVKTLDLTAASADIVLAGNGKVYVSPVRDQWAQLRAIDIATNTEVLSTGMSIRAGTVYKLHPDGLSIYGANRGLSPSDIEKINISVHPPAYLYDSPYHGDYAMCGDLWMSEDGRRIFTACGNVFRASSVRSQDMTYNGSLSGSGLNSIRHLTHSAAAGRVLVIANNPWMSTAISDDRVSILMYDHLELERTMMLPRFHVNANTYIAHGRFVFANAAGTEFYTVVQADAASGLLNDYGIVRSQMVPDPTQPTATPTATPTTTPIPSASPTPTPIAPPPSDVFFESNYASGAPGSMFILTAGGFPANSEATIELRRPGDAAYQPVVTLRMDANGRLVFVLLTGPNDPVGTYWIRMTVRTPGSLLASVQTRELSVVLDATAEQRIERPGEPVPAIPVQNEPQIYLPLVRKDVTN